MSEDRAGGDATSRARSEWRDIQSRQRAVVTTRADWISGTNLARVLGGDAAPFLGRRLSSWNGVVPHVPVRLRYRQREAPLPVPQVAPLRPRHDLRPPSKLSPMDTTRAAGSPQRDGR